MHAVDQKKPPRMYGKTLQSLVLSPIMPHPFHKRLLKEHRSLNTATTGSDGIVLVHSQDLLDDYTFRISVRDNLLYPEADEYYLSVKISQEYPVMPPVVKFAPWQGKGVVPVHPHVYLNGHICLNLLGQEWSPACSIESVVLSVQSMLSTNHVCLRPADDAKYTKSAPLDPSRTKFVYHDDDV